MTTDETTAPPDGAGEALTRELKRLVDESGQSLRAVSRTLSFSPSTISRATSGKVFPSREIALAIARTTGGDADHVERLWTAADEERRAAMVVPPAAEGDERELLRMTAAALDDERRRRTLSLDKLATTSGWSKSTLSPVFRGERVPDMSMLQDVLQAMGLSDAETGSWTARFARAAENARQPRAAEPAIDVAAVVAPLETSLRRRTIGLGVVATAALALSGLALWAANDTYYPSYEPAGTTTVTVGTPQPPGPLTAVVDLDFAGKRAAVFDQPRTDSRTASTLDASTRVVLVCRVDSGAEFRDRDLPGTRGETTSKVWVKISLAGKELGFMPSVYLKQDSDQLPVLPPPAC